MASLARPFMRTASRPQTLVSPLRQAARRSYSSVPRPAAAKPKTGLYVGAATVLTGGLGYYLYTQGQLGPLSNSARPTLSKPTKEDYQKVYNDVAELLENNDHDDGSYGPVLLPSSSSSSSSSSFSLSSMQQLLMYCVCVKGSPEIGLARLGHLRQGNQDGRLQRRHHALRP